MPDWRAPFLSPRPSCGRCGATLFGIGPCGCGPKYKPTPVASEDLDAAIRARCGDDAAGDAVAVVLDVHKPFLAELTGDGEWTGYQCRGCGPVEDWGSIHYPCATVLAIAKAMKIEVANA